MSTAITVAGWELQMPKIPSEQSEMSSVSEASSLLRRVAGPRDVEDSVKALIRRAARRLQWGFSRTKDIWYGNARRIDAAEMDRLRGEAARAEAEHLRARLVALRNGLAATDPELHRETIDALERALRAMGDPVGALVLRENRRDVTGASAD